MFGVEGFRVTGPRDQNRKDSRQESLVVGVGIQSKADVSAVSAVIKHGREKFASLHC